MQKEKEVEQIPHFISVFLIPDSHTWNNLFSFLFIAEMCRHLPLISIHGTEKKNHRIAYSKLKADV